MRLIFLILIKLLFLIITYIFDILTYLMNEYLMLTLHSASSCDESDLKTSQDDHDMVFLPKKSSKSFLKELYIIVQSISR